MLNTFTLFLFIGMSLSFAAGNKTIAPKGKHILWHEGGADYFAIFENGMLYTVHDNKYHKIHKVHDKEAVERIFQMMAEHEFTELPVPKNKKEIISEDRSNYKHIELRTEGRRYEAYWTDEDEKEDPDFLEEIMGLLMDFT